MQKNIAENVKITKLEKSKVEIIGSVKAGDFSSFRKKALENINNEVTIDGFRKGKVPENTLVAKVGDMTILEEMAELAISKTYPEIVINEKLDVIGRPEVHITKLALDKPLEFKIVISVVPEIKLGDYKKIAKEESKKEITTFEVTEKEMADAISKMKEAKADHPYEDDKFKEQLKTFLLAEKKNLEREKRRISISDKLLESSTADIPDVLTDSELRRIESQFSDDIQRMGVKIDDYFKHVKKTIEEIRKEWRPSAEKKAKLQLILNQIAITEKMKVDQKDIEYEVEHMLEHYKDADKDRATIYAETILTNEKVFKFLEGRTE